MSRSSQDDRPTKMNKTKSPAAERQRQLEEAVSAVRDAQEGAFFGKITFHFQSGKLTLLERNETRRIA